MPSANLATYLAKNYLTASNSRGSTETDTISSDFQDSSRPKKKRRKNKDDSTTSGLVIADDDEDLSLSRRNRVEVEDEDTPMYDNNVRSAEFRKKKGGIGWKVVSTGSTTTTSQGRDQGNENTDADRILAEAAEESRLRQQGIEDEDAPAIVEDVPETAGPRMQSGAKAGLQTAADTAALMRREELEQELERQKSKSKKSRSKATPEPEVETIYRDATGRRIDVSMKRAEARAAEQEKARAERKAKEDAMGEVQRREKQERKKDLEEAKFLTLGRSADDEAMNEELKERVRWDDPMAQYMAQKRAEEVAESSAVSGRRGRREADPVGKVRKKVYMGPPAAPNRYGILPGWRWDGVDRSNGFEKDWFQARSKKGRLQELDYQWQMDE
ncbi:Pre-mRNA-splicing factor cwc26 [Cladophialophora chaetospira]|uniref:Pre-mRNA-splicing factor cwc26 n=1 Tax=Cladophialophora chaetospira TaxID=386627 RepID=A0AA38X4R0_9EURO|nr:Pre-mRNA-splicing factor cwc26 [Cladophialophora chaetospira]